MMNDTNMEPCKYCGHTTGLLSKSGPHIKLSCAACGRYIKFIKQGRTKMALQNVGALWLKEKNGKKFMSGQLEKDKLYFDQDGRANILMYKNDYKEEDRHPDYKLMQVIEDQSTKPVQNVTAQAAESEIPF